MLIAGIPQVKSLPSGCRLTVSLYVRILSETHPDLNHQAIFDVKLFIPWCWPSLMISLSLVIQERHWVRYSV
jgi:hypothetical protein